MKCRMSNVECRESNVEWREWSEKRLEPRQKSLQRLSDIALWGEKKEKGKRKMKGNQIWEKITAHTVIPSVTYWLSRKRALCVTCEQSKTGQSIPRHWWNLLWCFSDFLENAEKRCNYSNFLDFNFVFIMIIPEIHLNVDMSFIHLKQRKSFIFDLILYFVFT